jgi:ABC-type branched-subunit amino acid transport system substrate-binding protein
MLIYGGEDFGPAALQSDGAAEIVLATVSCAEGLSPKGQEWRRKFEESFRETPGYPAFQAYDASRLVLDTLQQANSAGSLRLRDSLQRLETFDSLMGPLIFKDRRTRRPLFLLQIRGNETRLLKTVAPETQ